MLHHPRSLLCWQPHVPGELQVPLQVSLHFYKSGYFLPLVRSQQWTGPCLLSFHGQDAQAQPPYQELQHRCSLTPDDWWCASTSHAPDTHSRFLLFQRYQEPEVLRHYRFLNKHLVYHPLSDSACKTDSDHSHLYVPESAFASWWSARLNPDLLLKIQVPVQDLHPDLRLQQEHSCLPVHTIWQVWLQMLFFRHRLFR